MLDDKPKRRPTWYFKSHNGAYINKKGTQLLGWLVTQHVYTHTYYENGKFFMLVWANHLGPKCPYKTFFEKGVPLYDGTVSTQYKETATCFVSKKLTKMPKGTRYEISHISDTADKLCSLFELIPRGEYDKKAGERLDYPAFSLTH